MKIIFNILSTFLFISSFLCADPVKLELWHAMEGFIEGKLKELVDKFNTSQKEYEVQLVRKGNYTETYKEGIKATKEGKKGPHILQVYEIATPSLIPQKNLYIPVHKLLQHHGYTLHEPFIPSITDFYSDEKKQLLGLPFNIATGMLFYNKEAFQKAGIVKPPETWEDIEVYAVKLKNAGCSCAITTAWPSGYLLEHFAARHNLPFATKDNGFEGKGGELLVNRDPFVFNIKKFSEWQKKGIFKYGGRYVSDIEPLFTSGQCAMIMQSNSRMAILKKDSKFDVGGGPIPYWASLTKKPHNLVTGGAALWAMSGHLEEQNKGVATFFNFVAHPENQKAWVEATGYLPISKSAYKKLEDSEYYTKNPHNKIAIQSLMLPPSPYSKGIRVAGFLEVRDEALIPALEKALLKQKLAKGVLDEAVKIGNDLIRKAEQEND
ncbi:MAG: extracellular solute-binding protein [Alphaproteobacteria bacterium]|nr:extracellular solute-binding protein [Alphaproteobacteria bacterium]